eukprot:1915929-Rhodomonas_salina.1
MKLSGLVTTSEVASYSTRHQLPLPIQILNKVTAGDSTGICPCPTRGLMKNGARKLPVLSSAWSCFPIEERFLESCCGMFRKD